MAWKKGPLPVGTFGWGGIVREDKDPAYGFEWASFGGDHVHIGTEDGEIVEADKIAYYDNSIQLPVKRHMAKEE